jgi:hypothetical protein
MTRLLSLVFLVVFAAAAVGAAFAGDLPDPQKTPGAINSHLTVKQFRRLCKHPSWTKRVRPPEEYTYEVKRKQLRAGYGDYTRKELHLYEEDHLIPLCLGGAPRDERNLWPELWEGEWGAKTKDELEAVLCDMACRGEIALSEAQKEIATDWIAAYKKYVKKQK